MAWISIFPNYRHWQPMGGKGTSASTTPAGVSPRFVWLAASLLSMITLFPALTSVHAEENGNQRKLIERVEPEYPETLKTLHWRHCPPSTNRRGEGPGGESNLGWRQPDTRPICHGGCQEVEVCTGKFPNGD